MILTPWVVALMLLMVAVAWAMATGSDFPAGGTSNEIDAWLEYRRELRGRLGDAGIKDHDRRLVSRALWQAAGWLALAALVALWGLVHREW